MYITKILTWEKKEKISSLSTVLNGQHKLFLDFLFVCSYDIWGESEKNRLSECMLIIDIIHDDELK